MPLDAGTIAKYRHAAASKDRQAALLEIANLHPKNTVPVIIAIIQEAICKLPADNTAPETRAFLKSAEALLVDLHKKQNASLLKLPSILKEFTKEKITKDLTELVSKVEAIKMLPELVSISKEAELWLEGWYLHTYNMTEKDKNGEPVKDKNGVYPRIDNEDVIYYKVVGMTKMETAAYYGKVAELLRKKITNYQEKPVQAAPAKEPVVASNVPTVDVVVKDGITIIAVKISSLDANLIERIKAAVATACLPQTGVPLQDVKPVEVVDDVAIDEAELAAFLKCFSSENTDIKIQILDFVLTEYGLTDAQNNVLRNLKSNILAQLDSYSNSSYVVPFTKIPLPGGIFARTHQVLVDEKKNEVHTTSDAKGLFKILFDMRTTLIGRCSDDLLKKVNTLILDAYTLLERAPQAKVTFKAS